MNEHNIDESTPPKTSANAFDNLPRPSIPQPDVPPVHTPSPIPLPTPPQADNPNQASFNRIDPLDVEEIDGFYEQGKRYFFLSFAYAIPFLGWLVPFFCWKKTRGWKEQINMHVPTRANLIAASAVDMATTLSIFTIFILFAGLTTAPIWENLLSLAKLQPLIVLIYSLMAGILYFLCKHFLEEEMSIYNSMVMASRAVTGCLAMGILLTHMIGGTGLIGSILSLLYPFINLVITCLAIYASTDIARGQQSGLKVVAIAFCSWIYVSLALKGALMLFS